MIVEVVGVAVAVLVSDDTFGCDITNVVGASVGVVVGGRKVKVHVVEAVASSPVVSPGSWRPTMYSAPHRQVTVNIAALKIRLHSLLKTLKTPSKRSGSC